MRKQSICACFLSCFLLSPLSSPANTNSPIDWARLEKKIDKATPTGLPDLIQSFYRVKGCWPTNELNIRQFESERYGVSNAVKWAEEITEVVSLTPDAKDNLVLLWRGTSQGWEDLVKAVPGLQVHPTYSITIDKPSLQATKPSPWLTTLFFQWRTGDMSQRYKIATTILFDKLFSDEDINTVLAILGKPDNKFTPNAKGTPSNSVLIYWVKDSRFSGSKKEEVKLHFKPDGKYYGMEGRSY